MNDYEPGCNGSPIPDEPTLLNRASLGELLKQHMTAPYPTRGTGRTTEALKAAPELSYYVWCNHHLDYPKKLARELGRLDLTIVGPDFFAQQRWRGIDLHVTIDHAYDCSQYPGALASLVAHNHRVAYGY